MPRYIIKLKDNQDYTPMRGRRDEVVGTMKEKHNFGTERMVDALSKKRFKASKVIARNWLTNSVTVDIDDPKLLAQLQAMTTVESISEDIQFHALDYHATEVDPNTGFEGAYTWGVADVRAPDVWGHFNLKGEGMRVAVLDTGFHLPHSSLAGRLFRVNEGDASYIGGWAEWNGDGIRLNTTPRESDSHGTHVAGTVVGNNYSGYHIGVAPEAKIMAGLCLPDGTGSLTGVADSMRWAIDPDSYSGVATNLPAHVINMSLGANNITDPIMTAAVEAVYTAGVPLIVSIGNSNPGNSGTPGRDYSSLGIGAHRLGGSSSVWPSSPNTPSGQIVRRDFWANPPSWWPERWREPGISGPGSDVYSCVPANSHASYNGTSMSAPHVAGVVALMLQANPDLTNVQVYDILQSTARWDDRHRKTSIEDIRLGAGRVDALSAVEAAMNA